MKKFHRNLIIALTLIAVSILSFGIYQHSQLSKLTLRIHVPSKFLTAEQYANSISTFKDTLLNRRATEFSAYLEQVKFKRGDDSFLLTDADYLSGDASSNISITAEDDSKNVVKNYLVFKKDHQKYLVVDVQESFPDHYAVVEGEQYDYLYAELANRGVDSSAPEPAAAENNEAASEVSTPTPEGSTVRRVYKDVAAGPMKARLYADVEINSAEQVSKVIKMGWEKKSGGDWQLEDAEATWWLESTPDTDVNFRGSVVFTVKTPSKTTGDFSLQSLAAQGIDVSGTESSDIAIVRKLVDLEFGYSTV